MNINVIDSYVEFKIKFLKQCGLCFFFGDKDLNLVEEFLEEYFQTYINFFIYHTLGTLNKIEVFDYVALQKELEGLRIEIMRQYAANELIDSNEDYKYHLSLIDKSKEVSYFVSRLDNLSFNDNDFLEERIISFVNDNNEMLKFLGDNMHNLIQLFKNYYHKMDKFFKMTDDFYRLDYKKVSEENDVIYVKLVQQIKVLEINYKKALIERIFENDKLDEKKAIVIIQKLSKEILRKFLSKEKIDKYLVKITPKLFTRNKFLLEALLQNPLVKSNIILLVDYNTYTSKKMKLIDGEYNLACYQNFMHINDVATKLSNLDNEGVFSYVVVGDYKVSDKEALMKFQGTTIKELIIDKEV